MHPWFSLLSYRQAIVKWSDDDVWRYRYLIHQLPREFHSLTHAEQAAALKERPELTGQRRWDSFLAAIVEHIARLHDHPVPAWCDEPERFLGLPWVIPSTRLAGWDAVLFAPGAFIRHGVFPDPRDLDARGGEKHQWVPDD